MLIHLLQQAVFLHQQGHLVEAHEAYQQLLKQNPREINILNFLGVLCFQQGRRQEGQKYLKKCLQLKPDFAQAHYNLGKGLLDAGLVRDAIASLKRAATLEPSYAEAWLTLAEASGKNKDYEAALGHAQRALTLNPQMLPAWVNRGVSLHALKRFDEALLELRRGLAIAPDFPPLLLNLGRTLVALNRWKEAVEAYLRAVAAYQNDQEVLLEFGRLAVNAGRSEGALAALLRAIELEPGGTDGHALLGEALESLERHEEAEARYRKALELAPECSDLYVRLSVVLSRQGERSLAENAIRRALELAPASEEAMRHYGFFLAEADRLGEYFAYFDNVLATMPKQPDLLSSRLFLLNYSSAYSREICFQRAQEYGQAVAARVEAKYVGWAVERTPRRLRVGIVSGDLREHVVGLFLENVLASLDPDAIELIAYPTHRLADDLTLRIAPRFSAWKPLVGMSDQAAAALIHADGIHVLIDLAGHTGHNRLPLFAWKPAPVQVSWLGYFATTGVAEVDYLIADEVGIPSAHHRYFSEKIWTLPDTRLCFSPPQADVDVAPLPALRNGFVTFGCFQTLKKVQDPVLQVWAQVLAALPNARLRIQSDSLGEEAGIAAMRHRLGRAGIDPERVSLLGPVAREDYLAAHNGVDIILDTFPFPGGTTTCEALWMGVPTLTLAGDTLIARQGASLMTAAGLPDWVANDEADYVAKAVACATDVEALSCLRASLRQRALASPVFDAPRFARRLEEALWQMWRRC